MHSCFINMIFFLLQYTHIFDINRQHFCLIRCVCVHSVSKFLTSDNGVKASCDHYNKVAYVYNYNKQTHEKKIVSYLF